MDMLVVLAVVLVEVAFEVEGRMPELEACTFVVVFRLWRLPHACNSESLSPPPPSTPFHPYLPDSLPYHAFPLLHWNQHRCDAVSCRTSVASFER